MSEAHSALLVTGMQQQVFVPLALTERLSDPIAMQATEFSIHLFIAADGPFFSAHNSSESGYREDPQLPPSPPKGF